MNIYNWIVPICLAGFLFFKENYLCKKCGGNDGFIVESANMQNMFFLFLSVSDIHAIAFTNFKIVCCTLVKYVNRL